MTIAVHFDRVGFAYSTGPAVLTDITLQVGTGESLALLGRSGSGKSTLLKLINRLLEPTSGELRVEGIATTAWDPIRLRRRIGYVLQEIALFPHLTIARNVGVVPELEGWSLQRIDDRIHELLTMVGLSADRFASRFPHELSGGQRQRVGIARALAADPAILLMDEPFGALDPITRAELQHEFKALQSTLNKTTLMVTHDVPEACLLGTRIGLIQDGRLVECLPPKDFLRSKQPEVGALLRTLEAAQAVDQRR
jgi:osmoprotectant transport system ATP-binding protein